MDVSASLPDRLYLLAYDTAKQRLTGGGQLGVALRAAALTELLHGGHVSDVDGKPKATASRLTDPVLHDVLSEIAQSRPRSWAHWVGRHEKATFRAVQQRLADAHVISLSPYRRWGIFPATRVTLRDPLAVTRVRDIVARVLRGGVPAGQVDQADAALVALAVAGELRIAVSRSKAREHKRRIAELTERTGPAAPALRKVIQSRQAAAAAG